ncbi:hypothetical protein B0H13DRAFT_2344117 [Mycena leptocephala]|nr:hypothetical protein B0H13DRAFT_2344117 [Mycena leptocephala]
MPPQIALQVPCKIYWKPSSSIPVLSSEPVFVDALHLVLSSPATSSSASRTSNCSLNAPAFIKPCPLKYCDDDGSAGNQHLEAEEDEEDFFSSAPLSYALRLTVTLPVAPWLFTDSPAPAPPFLTVSPAPSSNNLVSRVSQAP